MSGKSEGNRSLENDSERGMCGLVLFRSKGRSLSIYSTVLAMDQLIKMKIKSIIKPILIGLAAIIGLPLFLILCIAGYNLYQNLNPNFVNLKKDGFVKAFSFVTIKKKIAVEIYGRPGKQRNTGEFVVVRTGLLPFGFKTISQKAIVAKLFEKQMRDSSLYYLTVWLDFKYIDISKLRTNFFVHLDIVYDQATNRLYADENSINYACCDYIPYFPYIEYYRCFSKLTYPETYSDPYTMVSDYAFFPEIVLKVFPFNIEDIL